MKIYTKSGDTGESMLFKGGRRRKDDPVFEAYGTLDELQANLGLVASLVRRILDQEAEYLESIQRDLFSISSFLAGGDLDGKVLEAAVCVIEGRIDSLEEKLPKLTQFILPGGTSASAAVQVARTVCRRAERRIVALTDHSEVPKSILKYINRLSDYLFVLARTVNLAEGGEEHFWKP